MRERHERQSLDEHLSSKRHAKKGTAGLQQQTIATAMKKAESSERAFNSFNLDMTEAAVKAGIPLSTLTHPAFKAVIEKHTNKHLYCRQTLQDDYLPEVYSRHLQSIREYIGDNDIFVILDETPDRNGRSVVNALVGRLNGHPTDVMLIKTDFFDMAMNSSIMGRIFLDVCQKMWPNGIQYERVLLVMTDAASYMKACFAAQKDLFSNMNHITCLAHAVHNVCETIRDEFDLVNDFIGKTKRFLSYSKEERNNFREEVGSLPPDPVITRWGTFLKAAQFYYNHLTKAKSVIEKSDSQSKGTKQLKNLVNNKSLENQFIEIEQYFFLIHVLTQLETRNAKAEDQYALINETLNKLTGTAKEKLEIVLTKNADLDKFMSGDMPFDHRKKITFAPLVSVDVERSFSVYKYILSDRRTRLAESSLEMLNALKFNSSSS